MQTVLIILGSLGIVLHLVGTLRYIFSCALDVKCKSLMLQVISLVMTIIITFDLTFKYTPNIWETEKFLFPRIVLFFIFTVMIMLVNMSIHYSDFEKKEINH